MQVLLFHYYFIIDVVEGREPFAIKKASKGLLGQLS
jgi:hypothetical protein